MLGRICNSEKVNDNMTLANAQRLGGLRLQPPKKASARVHMRTAQNLQQIYVDSESMGCGREYKLEI